MQLKIGTRKSQLALAQTKIVIDQIKLYWPDIECSIIPIITTGDKILSKNLYDIGGKALFLKELEEQLLSSNIDIAVHSMKDVPGSISDEFDIIAVTKRDDHRDCFISSKYNSIEDLPHNAVIGTSSVRRKVIIQNIRPDIKIVAFRGNINTRLAKLANNEVDATILAYAGLIRANLFDPLNCFPLSDDIMLPAIGQGALCIEALKSNNMAKEICSKINDQSSEIKIQAERAFLSYLDASCDTPVAALAELNGDEIKIRYMLSDQLGKNIFYFQNSGNISEAKNLGIKAGIYLKNKINSL